MGVMKNSGRCVCVMMPVADRMCIFERARDYDAVIELALQIYPFSELT